jgi:hypothetical protein
VDSETTLEIGSPAGRIGGARVEPVCFREAHVFACLGSEADRASARGARPLPNQAVARFGFERFFFSAGNPSRATAATKSALACS